MPLRSALNIKIKMASHNGKDDLQQFSKKKTIAKS